MNEIKTSIHDAALMLDDEFKEDLGYQYVGIGDNGNLYVYCKNPGRGRFKSLGLTGYQGHPVLVRKMGKIRPLAGSKP